MCDKIGQKSREHEVLFVVIKKYFSLVENQHSAMKSIANRPAPIEIILQQGDIEIQKQIIVVNECFNLNINRLKV